MTPYLVLAFALAVLAAAVVYTLLLDRRSNGGIWLWQRVALERRGLRGRAVVLSKVDRGVVRVSHKRVIHRFDLVLDVRLEGEQEPYRVSITLLQSLLDYTTAEGKEIPVRVDPRDRTRVVYDLHAVVAENEERRRAQEVAGEEKRRELLAEKPPPS